MRSKTTPSPPQLFARASDGYSGFGANIAIVSPSGEVANAGAKLAMKEIATADNNFFTTTGAGSQSSKMEKWCAVEVSNL